MRYNFKISGWKLSLIAMIVALIPSIANWEFPSADTIYCILVIGSIGLLSEFNFIFNFNKFNKKDGE
jgi:hypothetical protein